ncbi:MAG: molybdenum cofactor biosynthesis protein MoaE, partial [Hyphomicrobiales bacterium]
MIRVQAEDFDIGAEIASLSQGNTDIGAVVSFTGTVRGGDLVSMTLEHYPGMTEAALEEVESQARKRWPIIASMVTLALVL